MCHGPCRWTVSRRRGGSVSRNNLKERKSYSFSEAAEIALFIFVFNDLLPPVSKLLTAFPKNVDCFRGPPQDLIP